MKNIILQVTTYKNNAKACAKSKLRARLQRLIVLRTITLSRSQSFYTRRCVQLEQTKINDKKD